MKDDFERQWLDKLSRCLTERNRADRRDEIMRGHEHLSDQTSREEILFWTKGVLRRLQEHLSEEEAREVLLGCACQYPREGLADIRACYQREGNLTTAHAMLKDRFVAFLRDDLKLDEDLVSLILDRGWGLAGRLDGQRVIATKIPKSANLRGYLQEEDPEKRRRMYCHCPRIRSILASGKALSSLYCHCGGGFYKGVWEEILGRPVKVELSESVLDGGEVCRFVIDCSGPQEFIYEPVAVRHATPPDLEKKPGCPDSFVWRENTYRIKDLLSEWQDFGRRGRMAHNMRPDHAATAERRGSWGVGRTYFRVRLHTGQHGVLCYDRAPKNTLERKGDWHLISIDEGPRRA